MEQDLVDRIRSASFALARKGYDKREVDQFLDELADWLETGGVGEEAGGGSDLARRELERIGEQTTAILTEAHDAAQTMRAGAERQVRQQLADANIKADALRSSAEEYAEEVREEADAYARRVRGEAEAAAERIRIEAETEVRETRGDIEADTARMREEAAEYVQRVRSEADAALAEARQKAERSSKNIVEEAQRRRTEVEKVIADLEQRRESVIAELRRLASAAGIAPAEPSQPSGGGDNSQSGPESEARTTPLPVNRD